MEYLTTRLNEHRIDTEGAIARLGGKEMLYLTICKKFPRDSSYASVMDAIKKSDYTKVRMHLHTLKGVSANLGFQYLYALCNRLLAELDQRELPLFHQDILCLMKEYDIIIALLEEAL